MGRGAGGRGGRGPKFLNTRGWSAPTHHLPATSPQGQNWRLCSCSTHRHAAVIEAAPLDPCQRLSLLSNLLPELHSRFQGGT